MPYSRALNNIFKVISADERISVWHVSIYMTLLHLWNLNDLKNPVPITRMKVMKLAHVGSIVTYHKCVKQLQEFGYIQYVPSYNPFLGSKVYLFEPENDKSILNKYSATLSL